MNKKEYQLFGCVIARVKDAKEREGLISFLSELFKADNIRYDEKTFREFIRRLIANESLKDLKVNPKYMYWRSKNGKR
jgi:hypothetical protein